jgi:hypothetical protein
VGKQGFNLSEIDAAEHTLQIAGSTSQPDDDAHLGTLTSGAQCEVSFDLVAKVRVQG